MPPQLRALAAALAAGLLLLAAPGLRADPCPVSTDTSPERWQGEHAWQALEAAGYRIGRVRIQVDDVFDLTNPEEDTWYGRTADVLHVNTRPHVIREQLLFKPAQPVDARRIYESVRRLRSLPFLRYADITPASCSFGVAEVSVHVKDAWTLKFDLNFAHVGGQSSFGLSFKDVDFLGTGKTLAVGHQSDTERSRNQVSYEDPALLGSRWTLGMTYAHLSDGFVRSLDLGQPFYEDDAPWSLFIHYLDQQQNLNFYNATRLAWRATDTQQRTELDWMRLVDWEADTGDRAGFSFLSQDYQYGPLQSFPRTALTQPVLDPRRYVGVGGAWERFQDRYASFTNIALIGRTEDYNLGWDVDGLAGYFPTAFGSDLPAWFYSVSGTKGSMLGDETLVLGSADVSGRRQQGTDRAVLADLVFTLYDQHFDDQTLVAHGELHYSLRPEPEDLQYLGGLQGMPGYPNYLFLGDRRWQAHLSDRVTTSTRLLNIFQVGFAVYADAGQIRQVNTNSWSKTLVDAGIALRLGDVRSAYGGVIYVTYAWPLVKVPGATSRQFVIGNIINF